MIPKGDIWSDLRSSALDAMPSQTYSHAGRWDLDAWRASGEGRAVSSNKSSITILAPPFSYAGALLTDAQHYLDHAAEHRAFISKLASSAGECSPSWVVVSVYYWGLFSSLALSRLFGAPVIYFDKTQMATFAAGLPQTSPQPGAGAFTLVAAPMTSTSARTLVLSKIGSMHFHEATWQHVIKELSNRLTTVQSLRKGLVLNRTQSDEQDLFKTLTAYGFHPGEQWPSRLRNKVNYQAGLSYRSVLGSNPLDMYRFLRRASYVDISDAVSALDEFQAVSPAVGPESALKPASKALFLKTLLLNVLAEELVEEVLERWGHSKQWLLRRQRFLRGQLPNGNRYWPFAG